MHLLIARFCRYLLIPLSLASNQSWARQIAFTFDDAPMPDSTVMLGQVRTDLLLSNLKKADVNDALFFVTTKHIADKTAQQRIEKIIVSGFHIAHHSHAHLSANKLSTEDYLRDFDQAHAILSNFEHYLKLHRFPFLHHGKNQSDQQKLHQALDKRGFQDGYVTIDNAEWYLNHLYQQAINNDQQVNLDAFRQLYIETLISGIEYYDALAVKALKRSPKHVLLLHANDVSALFAGDLARALTSKGWEIISPQQAYQDPIASITPKTTYLKQGRVAALAHDAGVPENELKSPVENLEFLEDKFASVVFNPAEKPNLPDSDTL